ncbi:MAG: SsrA-binding protein SmpB [Flavobacterium sp.]|nr:SsrA-binding protein SmpB [Flavobacterium sp.]
MQKTVNIQNKRARFDYEIIDRYTAGIVLTGTEIKSIRLGKASIAESFCEFNNNELFLINATIEEYLYGNHYNHKAKSERKLLLNKKELKKLEKDSDNKGLTIIPLRMFTNDKGLAKLEIALCRGKKNYDKRESLKEKDTKRDLDRIKKSFKIIPS